MTRDDVTNGVSWLRRNLALVIAFVSLASSAGGWYASYSVLSYRVASDAAAIQELQKQEAAIVTAQHAHFQDTAVHVNAVTQKEIADRLTRIENLLIEHMGKR